jgi:hypothetical protein
VHSRTGSAKRQVLDLERVAHGKAVKPLVYAAMADRLVSEAAAPDSFTSLQTLAREIPCFRATRRSDKPPAIWPGYVTMAMAAGNPQLDANAWNGGFFQGGAGVTSTFGGRVRVLIERSDWDRPATSEL